LAVAVIAAAIADPIVEFSANAGWFGSGTFTDRSSLDVLPALILGVGLMALHFVRRARAILDARAPLRGAAVLLPAIFGLQMAVLYAMETGEQLAVWRHAFGPTLWLGGPPPIAIAIHAAVCTAVVCAFVRSRRRLAATALRVIGFIRAIATIGVATPPPLVPWRFEFAAFDELTTTLGATGERAPPILA
jgi:cytochrome bd-type quinol oxidase subunit 2